MIILEAILTFLVVFLLICASGILIYTWAENGHESAPLVLGMLGTVVSVLAATFQGVALTGTLVVTDAVFTYISATAILFGAIVLTMDRETVGWGIFFAALAIASIVCQSVALAI